FGTGGLAAVEKSAGEHGVQPAVGDVRLLWQFKCLAVASDDLASVDLLREYVEQLKKQTRDPVLLEWLKQVMMLPGDRPIMPSTQVIRSSNDIKPGKGPMD
ncbi:MAG TPA: hypothetical protein PK402_14080, partial [Tepidisphaeraceae bacterium]|nr:hypothetical protein [Tepidisphaeraceae bacterium]